VKKTFVLLCTLALAALIGVSVAGSAPRPSAYVLPGDNVFPEGIDYWGRTGQFFVSSTGDGSVLRGEIDEPTAQAAFVAPTGVMSSAIGVKVDKHAGLLYIAGGPTGTVRVASATTGAVLKTFTSGPGGFLNDLVVTENGDVYVTDSFRPTLWRIRSGAPAGALEPWLSFTSGPLQYTPGFNLNGIVETPGGAHLVVTQSSTGKLFRITVADQAVQEIDLGGELVRGDGLELDHRTLYAVAGGAIAKVELEQGFLSGEVVSRTTDPSWLSPTTITLVGKRLLVVNSQFARRGAMLPPILPFTVSTLDSP
jgi:sugar lactone lactonase YvrE